MKIPPLDPVTDRELVNVLNVCELVVKSMDNAQRRLFSRRIAQMVDRIINSEAGSDA